MKHPLVYILASSRIAIETAMKKKAILSKLEKVGYDLPKLKEGKALNEKATIMQMLSKDEEATDEGFSKRDLRDHNNTEKCFTRHLQLARLTFHGNEEMNNLLGLTELNELSASWLDRADQFYSLLSEKEISIYGISKEEITQARAEVHALLEDRSKELTFEEEAQTHHSHKKKTFDELEKWMHLYRDAAITALKDHPQLLEDLGFNKTVSQ
ncbi:hypothetical protein WJR50_11010 [Catalinimonas sp. 4WD22]|uniref:hypothetical protein n=1 Tax=Catalinimonas locisalis TaxID=3133978 RepID=UPI003100BA71